MSFLILQPADHLPGQQSTAGGSRSSDIILNSGLRIFNIFAMLTPFHIAFPVHDLEKARHFYGTILACEEGRSSDEWIDFDLYGHQVVAHLKKGMEADLHHNAVDGHAVPVPHFGVVLEWKKWEELAVRLRKEEISFIIEPYIRFEGEVGEQATMFFLDPSGNALEFKAFKHMDQLFAK